MGITPATVNFTIDTSISSRLGKEGVGGETGTVCPGRLAWRRGRFSPKISRNGSTNKGVANAWNRNVCQTWCDFWSAHVRPYRVPNTHMLRSAVSVEYRCFNSSYCFLWGLIFERVLKVVVFIFRLFSQALLYCLISFLVVRTKTNVKVENSLVQLIHWIHNRNWNEPLN